MIRDVVIGVSANTALSNTSNYYVNITASGTSIAQGTVFAPTSMLHVRGTGATSATTSLLVQNSAGTNFLSITDDGSATIGTTSSPNIRISASSAIRLETPTFSNAIRISGNTIKFNGTTDYASAVVSIDSTTQGFLPPRMTTTQKNAIASPASGLVVYDTTLGKLCVRGASAWETITSV
jgi:hypothetical protein